MSFAREVMHEAKRGASSNNTLVVDLLSGDTVSNVYSDRSKASNVHEVTETLTKVTSTNQALVQAVKRTSELGKSGKEVRAVVLAPGTCDSTILAAISDEAANVSVNTRLYILGITAQNRLCMSHAFRKMPDRIKFATSENEWIQILRKL